MAEFYKESSLWPSHFPIPSIGWRSSVQSQLTTATMDTGSSRVRMLATDFPQGYEIRFRVATTALLEEVLTWMKERRSFLVRLQTGVGYLDNTFPATTKNTVHSVRPLESPKVLLVGHEVWDISVRWYCESIDAADSPIPI